MNTPTLPSRSRYPVLEVSGSASHFLNGFLEPESSNTGYLDPVGWFSTAHEYDSNFPGSALTTVPSSGALGELSVAVSLTSKAKFTVLEWKISSLILSSIRA